MTSCQLDYTETTGWGKCDQPDEIDYVPLLRTSVLRCILITQRHAKIINPTNTALLNLLPLDILAAIYNWIASLKYQYKSKHVLLCFKSMSNPVPHTTPTK